MKTILALVTLASSLLVLAGCSGKEESGKDVVWRLDREATIRKADPEAREAVKKNLAGLDIVLRLHGSRFDFGITGSDRVEKSSGTFATGRDELRLHRTTLNGAAVPTGTDADLVLRTDSSHVYVGIGEIDAILSAK